MRGNVAKLAGQGFRNQERKNIVFLYDGANTFLRKVGESLPTDITDTTAHG